MQIVWGNKPGTITPILLGVLLSVVIPGERLVAQEEELEEITVTGSRISRDPNLGAPVAVQSVSAEDIELSGRLDVVEVVREIPALLTSESADSSASLTGSAFDTDDSSVFSSAGESVLQLRGMGLERTLVLVDGRRHVAGSPGSSSVDVNTIPTSLIERVEVITGGASAIYGADAVTGVVNFIMKDDFDGLEFTAQGGVSSEGDGEDYRLSGVYGLNFDNDRGNFTVAVDYRTREPVKLRDRDWAADNRIGLRRSHPDLRFQDGDILVSMERRRTSTSSIRSHRAGSRTALQSRRNRISSQTTLPSSALRPTFPLPSRRCSIVPRRHPRS